MKSYKQMKIEWQRFIQTAMDNGPYTVQETAELLIWYRGQFPESQKDKTVVGE